MEVDFGLGGVIAIDTRAARKGHIEALALRRESGVVFNAREASRGRLDHLRIKPKSRFNRLNEHKGNPWMIARYRVLERRKGRSPFAQIDETYIHWQARSASTTRGRGF